MDDVTWTVLTLCLTALGAVWTWFAFRRRGVASGLRGTALTLLPLAALLTGTLRMFTRIVDAVLDWATSLVFSPSVWIGVVLAGLAVVLFMVSGLLAERARGAVATSDSRSTGRDGPARSSARDLPAGHSQQGSGQQGSGQQRSNEGVSKEPSKESVDSEFDDIEALLRKRGIN